MNFLCQCRGKEKRTAYTLSAQEEFNLLLHNLQNFHGAGLGADAAGNALGGRILGLEHHDLHGTSFDTLAAADTLLLVDHVHTGLGILGDGIMLTGAHALAALDTDVGLGTGALGNDLNTAQGNIKLLIKSLRAGLNTLQACHTFCIFLDSELLHS